MRPYKCAYYRRTNNTIYIYSKYLLEEKSLALKQETLYKKMPELMASRKSFDFSRFADNGSTFLGKYKENLRKDLKYRLFHGKKFFIKGKRVKLKSNKAENEKFERTSKIYRRIIKNRFFKTPLYYENFLSYFLFLLKLKGKFNNINVKISLQEDINYFCRLLNKINVLKDILTSSMEKKKFMINVKKAFSLEHSDDLWEYTKKKLKKLKYHRNYLTLIRKYNHRKFVNALAIKYEGYIDKKSFLNLQIKNFVQYYNVNYNIQENYRPVDSISFYHEENPNVIFKNSFAYFLKKKKLYGLSGIVYSSSKIHKPISISSLLGFYDKKEREYGYVFKRKIGLNQNKIIFYSNNLISYISNKFLLGLIKSQTFSYKCKFSLLKYNLKKLDKHAIIPVINPEFLFLSFKNKTKPLKKRYFYNLKLKENFAIEKKLNLKFPRYKEWKRFLRSKAFSTRNWPSLRSIFFKNESRISSFFGNSLIINNTFDDYLLEYLRLCKSQVEVEIEEQLEDEIENELLVDEDEDLLGDEDIVIEESFSEKNN